MLDNGDNEARVKGEYLVSELNLVSEQLAKLSGPDPDSRRMNMRMNARQALRYLRGTIEEPLAKDLDIAEVATELTRAGIEVTTFTTREVLWEIRRSERRTRSKRRNRTLEGKVGRSLTLPTSR
jgi:hypothetical protein